MKRVLTVTILAAMLLSLMLSPAYAVNGHSNEAFIEFLYPFYNVEKENFVMFNKDNIDVTEDFWNATNAFALEGEWDSIYNYYVDNLDRIEYIPSISLFYDDVYKVVYKSATYTLSPVNSSDVEITGNPSVRFDVRVGMYYDPNTAEISRLVDPQLVTMYCDTFVSNLNYTSPVAYINDNRLSAQIEFTASFVFDTGELDFEEVYYFRNVYASIRVTA